MTIEEYHLQWFWEGNVQVTLLKHLRSIRYHILFQADTRTHQRGIDIVAERDGQILWITVKGYPREKVKTNPRLQSVHWFSSALYDIIKYREKDRKVSLAVALPDFSRYRDLAKEVSWFKSEANFIFFWVKPSGELEIE